MWAQSCNVVNDLAMQPIKAISYVPCLIWAMCFLNNILNSIMSKIVQRLENCKISLVSPTKCLTLESLSTGD
jgi:hypothetical protein